MIQCIGYQVLLLNTGPDRIKTMAVLRKYQPWLQPKEAQDLVNGVPGVVATFAGQDYTQGMAKNLEASGATVVVMPLYGDVPPIPPGSFGVDEYASS